MARVMSRAATEAESSEPRRAPAIALAVDPRSECDVVVDGFRERIPALKDHPGALPEGDDVRVGGIDVLSVEEDRPGVPRAGDERVEAIDRA